MKRSFVALQQEESATKGPIASVLLARMQAGPRSIQRDLRLIIVSPYTERQFVNSHASKVLRWGLERKGMQWRLHNPAHGPTRTEDYDAALFWPYGFARSPGFIRHCLRFEARARERGLAVINSMEGCTFTHSWCLGSWQAAGVRCAKYQFVKRFEDIYLSYPMILRTDRIHRGMNMHLVHNPAEARKVFATNPRPLIDMAIEFVDACGEDGYFRKWRSHVIGNRVIPRQTQLSRLWKVNLDGAESLAKGIEEDRRFIREGEPHKGLVLFAAKTLKSEVIALDYSKMRDGSYIFWEGNRNFDLSIGGEMWQQFQTSTGRSDEECAESLEVIGDAIADLIVDRARYRPSPSSPLL